MIETRLSQLATTKWLYVMALGLGLLQALVFDFAFNSSIKWLAPVLSLLSLGVFLLLVKRLTPHRAALFGYVFGLGVFGWGLNWVYISMATFGGAPLTFAVGANALVVAYLALYWLLAAYLIAKLGKTPSRRLLLAAPIITLLEWGRSVFLIGFPWLSIGYGFVDVSLAWMASLGGVFFVSFIVVFLVALHLLDGKKRYYFFPLSLALLWGALVPMPSTELAERSKATSVTLIQGNMPVITKYDDTRMTQNLVKYMQLTDEALAKNTPDVLIWPESAVPYFYIEAREFLGSIYDVQRDKGFDLITGVPNGDWSQPDRIYNSILLQRADNPKPRFYNKQHLLPFGEYLPFRSVFAFFKDFVEIPMSDFARGEAVQPPFLAGGLEFSPSICFEAVFGSEIRKNAQHADVLLNVSNDAWFGKSKAQAQHLNIARMRAIENQKMLVRATNDGLTAVVDLNGRVLKSLPPFADGVLHAEVYGNSVPSLYSRLGEFWLLILFSIIIVLLVTFSRAQRAGIMSDCFKTH